jgi:threonine aldolase
VIVGGEAHILWHETGAAAVSGVQLTALGSTGVFGADELHAAYKPRGHIVFPPTTLVVVENTHNRGGGIVFGHEDALAVCKAAAELGMETYLDGARLFNAAVESGRSLRQLAEPFRLVSVALSKGLGCPVGSVLAGSKPDIDAARRVRRMFGGAMRQAGVLAAAGLFALDHNLERLAIDHANARGLAEAVVAIPGVLLDLTTVQTNIIVFRLADKAPDATTVVEQAKREGVLVSAFGPRTIRVVTHLDVDAEQCERAGKILAKAIAT